VPDVSTQRHAGQEGKVIEPCKGCGSLILLHRIANLVVKADPAPLTDVGDILKLIAGPNPPSLWAVETNQAGQPNRLRGARPGETGVVPEHRCTRVGGQASPPVAPSRPAAQAQTAPELSEAESVVGGPARPGDASTPPFSATRRTNPVCDGCFRPCEPGTYASVELGDILQWAHHVTECPS